MLVLLTTWSSSKDNFGKFEHKLQVLVLLLCCYEWKMKQDLTYAYTSHEGLNPLLCESNLGKSPLSTLEYQRAI